MPKVREEERVTEDDIAKKVLGEQGVPSRPPKAPIADEDELARSIRESTVAFDG
jgi:hypothetical protein